MIHPPHRAARYARPSLLILALLALVLGAAALRAAPQASQRVYLPVVLRDYQGITPPQPGIFGKVTDLNQPAPGVELTLRRYNDDDEETVATTTTDSQGAYRFSGVPALPPGYTYYVRFGPNDDVDTRLWYWFGVDIDSYAAGTAVPGSDFDIGDVALREPANGARVALPLTFRWERRMVPGDDYVVELFDPESGDAWFTSNLGDVSQFTVNTLPPAVVADKVYGWTMWVYHGDDSWGIAYWYRDIIFDSTAQAAGEAGAIIWQRAAPHGRAAPRR